MTINEITEESVEQRCNACGGVRSLKLEELTIGVSNNDQLNENVLPLPPCDTCGAVEFLMPTKEDTPPHPSPGSFGHKHAILVDVLFERLIVNGRHIEEIQPGRIRTRKRSSEDIRQWFGDGPKLKVHN